MFYVEHTEWIFISNVFVSDLKTGNSTNPMLMIISPESDESRKLNYLKLPHLWNQQSFLGYSKWALKTTQFSKGKRREDHINSISVIIYSRSSYQIQFNQFQNLMNMDYPSTEDIKWWRQQATVLMNSLFQALKRPTWFEDLPTVSIILEDLTPVHLWRPHFGGDC